MDSDSGISGGLKVGDTFPPFQLKNENGDMFDSSDMSGRRYIIYFYPKDNTSGCTREAKDFTAALPTLSEMDVDVIGVSKDSSRSHRNFIDKQELGFSLLSDPEHVLMEKVGAWGSKISYGKETTGTIRSTFVVGADGRVENMWKNVRVAGHVDTVVDSLRG
ncbi:MAG: peroxiredoxin [Candidatus Methanomethylophilaceae archaeon]